MLFKDKKTYYTGSDDEDDKKAVASIDRLCTDLDRAKLQFLKESQEPFEAKKEEFKEACLTAIKKSRKVLEHHRGWKQALADFASLIVSFITFGGANLWTGRGMFGLFPTRTDSAEQLDEFTESLKFTK